MEKRQSTKFIKIFRPSPIWTRKQGNPKNSLHYYFHIIDLASHCFDIWGNSFSLKLFSRL